MLYTAGGGVGADGLSKIMDSATTRAWEVRRPLHVPFTLAVCYH